MGLSGMFCSPTATRDYLTAPREHECYFQLTQCQLTQSIAML